LYNFVTEIQYPVELTVQKISKNYTDALQLAIKYYSIVCILNSITITERQLQVLAFTAIRGNISSITAKQEFARTFSTSLAVVRNVLGELKKLGLIQKINDRYKVNPQIDLAFDKDLLLHLHLKKNVQPDPLHTKGQA
jgi:ribosomal protein S19E (S16A)